MPFEFLNAQWDDGRDAISDLRAFANMMGLDRVMPGRYSYLALLHLFTGANLNQLNPYKVMDQIENLEGLITRPGLKPATQFKHPPLAGLWHQHFLMDGVSSMAINLRRGIHKFGLPWFENEIAELAKTGEERYLEEQDIDRLVHDAVHGNWQRLNEAGALTGEWIIFAKYEGSNYYLCLGTHKTEDNFIRSELDLVAETQFPFLKKILSN